MVGRFAFSGALFKEKLLLSSKQICCIYQMLVFMTNGMPVVIITQCISQLLTSGSGVEPHVSASPVETSGML